LLWPNGRGRKLARQISAVAVLAFREGVRLKVLWTVFLLALIPGVLAYYSDADGTHVGRASLILNYCLSAGEVLGAVLIVLLCALSVAREIESRIMHTFGTKPVPRWAILAGKAFGFWAIDLLFLLGVTVLAGVLVRAVPMRAETREANKLVPSGTWDDLHRNALTTRQYLLADEEIGSSAAYKLIAPGKSRQWTYTLTRGMDRSEPLVLRFQVSSSEPFQSHLPGTKFVVAFEGAPAPILTRTEAVPQDRPFDFFVEPKDVAREGKLVVTITAPELGRRPATLVVAMRLGVPVDGFSSNLLKAFLLMALQGWILAFITASWSGVLSFPVTVALGAILVLGGEMSRQATALLETSASRLQALGLEQSGESAVQKAVISDLRLLLQMLPDFRVLGGPTAFVDGDIVSGWALAQAGLSMGVARVLGWSLLGVFLFHRREVGR